MQESGPVEYHQILDELSSGPVGKYLDKSDIWQFSNPSSYGNLNKAVAKRIYSSPRFAAEIGQILTAR